MDLLKEFFGVGAEADDAATKPAAPAGDTAQQTEEERQQAREAKREAKRANRQARKVDPATEAKRTEFADRYKTGHPSEGFEAEEALEHLEQLQGQLTPAEFRKAMEETLNRLPADQRDEFAALMRKHQVETQAGSAATAQDPFGGLLGGLVGSPGATNVPNLGDVLNDLRQGGLNAPAPAQGKQLTDQDFLQLINSPLGKAVLGGLATYGMQQLQQQQEERKTQRAEKNAQAESAE
jgi:hypothetical protein